MRTVPLRYLAELNPPAPEFDRMVADAIVGFLPLEAVWADSRADHTRTAKKCDVASGYTRYLPGDIVVPKVTPTFQAARSMVTKSVGAGTTELHVLRPRFEVDPRWVCYAVRTVPFLREGVTAFQGVAGLQRVPPEFVNGFRVADKTPEEQRRIADFLDDRVSRIDRIIAARREQVARAGALLQSALSQRLVQPADELAPLRRLGVSVTTGPFGTVFAAAQYVDDGVPMINPSHIRDGEIYPDRTHSVSPDTALRLKRHMLREGDLVVSRKGDIGRTAMVRPHQDGWICGSDSIALHGTNSRVLPEMLDLLLRLDFAREQLLSQSYAATMPSLNEGNLLSLRIPVLSMDEQKARALNAREAYRSVSDFIATSTRSIDLLTEYKSSLVTAAVTGDLDVTTAGSNIPG